MDLAQACCHSNGSRSQQTAPSLAPHVMAVNPNPVMVMPTPVSRHPNIVHPTDVVAWPVDVIWPVTNFDVHNHGVGSRNHRREHCQNYSDFQFHSCNFLSDLDERWTPFIRDSGLGIC